MQAESARGVVKHDEAIDEAIRVLNGIFGCDGNRVGWICADYSNGWIVTFRRT